MQCWYFCSSHFTDSLLFSHTRLLAKGGFVK